MKPVVRHARWFSLPFFPIIAAPFMLYAYPLLTGRTLFWGLPALQFIPWQTYAYRQLAMGLIPLWNPLNGMGAPLLANYQLAFFYPPTWPGYLFAWLGGTPALAWWQTFLVPLHLAWAGIGMALLVRRLGLGSFPQAISGLAFCLGGYFTARSSFYTMIWAGAWLPWILWCASQIAIPVRGGIVSGRFLHTGLAITIGMLLLAGHAQLAWYTLGLATFWVGLGGWIAAKGMGAIRAVSMFTFHAGMGAAIAAVQLLPTAEYLLQSQRSSAVDFELGLTYSFWPWRLLTLLAPNLFGNPGIGNYWGYASFWEDAIYLGIPALLLAVSTISLIWKKNPEDRFQPVIRMLWLIVLIGALLALGNNTPLFPFLYRTVPTFSLFNGPARWMIWLVAGLAILSAIGASRWVRPTGKGLRRLRRWTAASIAITVGAGAGWLVLRDIQSTFLSATAMVGVWATGFCLLTLFQPSEEKPRSLQKWQSATVIWLALDLLVADACLGPTIPANTFEIHSPTSAFPSDGGRVFLNGQDEYGLKFKRFFRFSDYQPIEDWSNVVKAMLPNTNLLSENSVPFVNNFDPIVPGRFSRWMDWVDHLPADQQTVILQMMNVSRRLHKDAQADIGLSVEDLKGLNRFRWITCAQWAVDEDSAWISLKRALLDQVDFSQLLWLEETPGWNVENCDPGQAKIDVIRDSPGSITLDVDATQAGYLFIADTWYPGWTGKVDGVQATIYRANVLFQSIRVQPGRHRIKLEYRPNSVYAGGLLTSIAIIFLTLWGILHQHRVK